METFARSAGSMCSARRAATLPKSARPDVGTRERAEAPRRRGPDVGTVHELQNTWISRSTSHMPASPRLTSKVAVRSLHSPSSGRSNQTSPSASSPPSRRRGLSHRSTSCLGVTPPAQVSIGVREDPDSSRIRRTSAPPSRPAGVRSFTPISPSDSFVSSRLSLLKYPVAFHRGALENCPDRERAEPGRQRTLGRSGEPAKERIE